MTDPLTPDDLAALRDYAKRYHESPYATEKNLAFNLLRLLDEVERQRGRCPYRGVPMSRAPMEQINL